jgi:hypothetical protein
VNAPRAISVQILKDLLDVYGHFKFALYDLD